MTAAIHVSVDDPLVLSDTDGTVYRFMPGVQRTILPVDVYRRMAPLGMFRRHMRLVEKYGRTFWMDMLWESWYAPRELHPERYKTVRTNNRRSGCGCGGKKKKGNA